MKIEQFLQTKSKEEIAFILYGYNGKSYKIPCIECSFFKKDKFGIYKCTSFLNEQCRKEYTEWADKEMING